MLQCCHNSSLCEVYIQFRLKPRDTQIEKDINPAFFQAAFHQQHVKHRLSCPFYVAPWIISTFFTVTVTRLCSVHLGRDVRNIGTDFSSPSAFFCLLFGGKTLLQTLTWNQKIACCKNRLSAFISMAFFTSPRQMKHLKGVERVGLLVPVSPQRERMLFPLTHTYICVCASMKDLMFTNRGFIVGGFYIVIFEHVEVNHGFEITSA